MQFGLKNEGPNSGSAGIDSLHVEERRHDEQAVLQRKYQETLRSKDMDTALYPNDFISLETGGKWF